MNLWKIIRFAFLLMGVAGLCGCAEKKPINLTYLYESMELRALQAYADTCHQKNAKSSFDPFPYNTRWNNHIATGNYWFRQRVNDLWRTVRRRGACVIFHVDPAPSPYCSKGHPPLIVTSDDQPSNDAELHILCLYDYAKGKS